MAPGPVADGFDLTQTFVHLGLGSTATPLPDFTWSRENLESYEARFASDGPEGRLVCVTPQEATWDTWERHPAGEEVVFLISGRCRRPAGDRRRDTSWSCGRVRPW